MALTNDPKLAKRLAYLRTHGIIRPAQRPDEPPGEPRRVARHQVSRLARQEVLTGARWSWRDYAAAVALVPAVPIKKSITPDALISFIDGKPYKSLKRHLTKQGLTPAEYRQRYGLSKDYPMVAASYSKARSELEKSLGLGQFAKGRKGAAKGSKKKRAAA